MTMQTKYQNLLHDEDVRRWFENLIAKSILTATVALRNLAGYCEPTQTDPKEILEKARANEKDFSYEFTDFEENGKGWQSWFIHSKIHESNSFMGEV